MSSISGGLIMAVVPNTQPARGSIVARKDQENEDCKRNIKTIGLFFKSNDNELNFFPSFFNADRDTL